MPISGEPLRGFSVQEASRACDTSPRCFVRQLLIGPRDILHPPNRKHSHQPTPHSQLSTHGRTSLLACPVKRQWAVSHDAVFRREKPSLVRDAMLIPYRQHSFYFHFRISRGCSAHSGEIMQYNILEEISSLQL